MSKTLYDILGYKDLPLEERVILLRKMWDNDQGRYVGYFTSLESSGIGFSDDLDILKGQWCFGMAIFEANGLTKSKIKELFPYKPERPTVLNYLKANNILVHREGNIIGEDWKN